MPPVALTDGALNTYEGCASICDPNGNILFYTDGMTVYNKQHQVMANGTGLLGHSSSTQSAIILPWPEQNDLYYILTSGEHSSGGHSGYNYSVVDITKNSGLGEIIIKNQLLYSPATEKLTATLHANGIDWWVITKSPGDNSFYSYLITKNGISTAPIKSNAGSVHTNLTGCMKLAPNGKKLAVTANLVPEVLDFDNRTGIISNGVRLTSQNSVYGLEFSANSQFLYCADMVADQINQFDLTSYTDATSLEATRETITPAGYANRPMGMQLGPDGRIYVASINIPLPTTLDVINFPEQKGTACGFEENAVDLNGRSIGFMLPNMIFPPFTPPSFTVDASISITDPCQREVQLSASSNQMSNISYTWDLGNGTNSSLKEPKAFYPFSKDAFDITLEVTADVPTANGPQRQTKSLTKQVTFNPAPKANAGQDLTVTAGYPLTLNGSGGISYQWSPSQYLNNAHIANPIATLYNDQTFTLKVFNADGCVDVDQVHVKVYKEAAIYVPTGFTPNGDGKNDILNIFPIGVKLKSFSIYNRWGNLVFTTEDSSKGWNGSYNGKQQPRGTYTWVARIIDLKGQPVLQKGTLTLIR